MRIFSFISLILICPCISAQLLNLEKSWFTNDNFFNPKEIHSKKIKSIRINRSKKVDGSAFQKKEDFLEYLFNKDGNLAISRKLIPLSNRIDTATFLFYYDRNNKVYKRTEKQGPFNFSYYFVNKDNQTLKEIKINGNSPGHDTAYIRHYQHQEIGNEHNISVLNNANKAFMKLHSKRDRYGRTLLHKTTFTRTANYSETTFEYQLDWLIEKKMSSYFGNRKDRSWTYIYNKNSLDFVTVKESDLIKTKYGFTYTDLDLIDAIVERDLERQTMVVYKLEYEFYD